MASSRTITSAPIRGKRATPPSTVRVFQRWRPGRAAESIKALINDMFGEGIMTAIDFELAIDRVEDPKGDRVKVTYNGKFLPYRKW